MAKSPWSPRGNGLSLLSDERSAWKDATDDDARDDAGERAKGKTETARKKALVEEALERFRTAVEAESDQRAREREDLEFDRALPEDQWPAEIRKARAGGIGPDGRGLSERPCLVIPKLDQPVQQVINEARQARLAIEVKPKGNNASTAGADLRQGLIRSIEADSGAQVTRLWALERAVKCGRGYYRVLTEYANDGDFDLDLRISRILNQGCVYLDPHATQPDWSDGEWAFITDDLSKDEYRRRYGDSPLLSMSADELTSLTDRAPGWLEADSIRVAEYFYIEHESRELLYIPSTGAKLFADEWPDGTPIPPEVKRRKVDQRTVRWCVINADTVLDEQEWLGRYIPIVPVTGKEYIVDGDRCWKGMVSNAKDAQRSYNYMRSAQVEAVGLAPKAPWIMAEGQDEGYERMWDAANTRNFPRLLYKPTSFEGNQVPPPQRNVAEPAIQAISLAVREAEADIKATTGRFDPSLGQVSGERSGRAIKELKQQGENSSSNYLENLASISMLHEARILLDLLPKVYDRQGRIVRLLGDRADDEKQVLLGQPMIPGPDGRPLPAPPPVTGVMGRISQAMRGQAQMPEAKTYDLQDGDDYTVQVSVGKSFATEREANLGLLETIIEATKGQAAPLLMDLWAEQLGGPMGREMAKRFRDANPALKGDQQGGIPPQVQQQMQMAQQQMAELQQKLQEAEQKVAAQTEKAKADLVIAQMEIQSKERIASMQVQADLAKTKATLGSKEGIALLEAEEARLSHMADTAHSAQMLRAEHEHALQNETAGRLHEALSHTGDRRHAAQEAERDRAHAGREAERGRQDTQQREAAARQHDVQTAQVANDQALKLEQQKAATATKIAELKRPTPVVGPAATPHDPRVGV